jgi:H+/Cl- antiporter ClcA
LSRGTHREFGYKPLLLMLVFYFCGAAVIAGSALSTGLFVPMLVIGCLIGAALYIFECLHPFGNSANVRLWCHGTENAEMNAE